MIVGSNILAGASGQQGYFLNRSVRTRSSASAYFNRTFGTPTSGTTWTWSGWVKLGAISTYRTLFGAANAGSFPYASIILTDTDNIYVNASPDGGTNQISLITTAVYRDPSAWYHVIFVHDSTQATASNRCKLYINGVQITSFSTATYPSQNSTCAINTNGYAHAIGRRQNGSTWYFDGYLTEINFIDGQALTPTSFGEYNTITGVWQPKKYGGTYGTNGFYLNFNDNSAATAAAIGKDSSGNGNNWTPNNISVTAGTTYDSMTDVPTLTSATQANYSTLNPLYINLGTLATLTNGNLYVQSSVAAYRSSIGTIQFPTSGKYYFEATIVTNNGSGTNQGVGITSTTNTAYNFYLDCFATSATSIRKILDGSPSGSYGPAGNGTVIGVAVDADNGKAYLAVNNTWIDSSSPTGGTGGYSMTSGQQYAPFFQGYNSGQTAFNFGAGSGFSYTPPTGFVALNTYNLPTPTIANGANYMAATILTGVTGRVAVVKKGNGVSFQPDFVWMKCRSVARNHELADSVRGTAFASFSNLTNAEASDTRVSSFNSNGWNVGTNSNSAVTGDTEVGWSWKASNAAAVTNTSGSISSQVNANPSAGFSIVTYTGTLTTTPGVGAMPTVGHGLNAVPKLIISKSRNVTGADSGAWAVFSGSIATDSYLRLNTTAGTASVSGGGGGTMVAPTSSVFSTPYISGSNINANNYVAYCFSEIPNFSKFGSYIGNGSPTDGTFVYCGFRPRWIMVKRLDATGGDWQMYDTSQNPYNVSTTTLAANSSGGNGSFTSGYNLDFLSNGFKWRSNGVNINASTISYIFAAFAENPFNYSLAR